MNKRAGNTNASHKPIIVDMPKTRNPFTNVPPQSLGFEKSGMERFWIPSSNENIGATSVLFNENGDHSLYHIGRESRSMRLIAQQDENRIWITGGKSAALLLLDLRTGKYVSRDIKGLAKYI